MKSLKRKILSSVLNFIFGFFKIQDNKIVFEASRGLVDGNTRAIYDYIVKNNINNFKTIWLVSKNTDVSELRNNDYVYYKTLKNYYHLATAQYFIRSQSDGSIIKKRRGQVYIQLWHGNGAMKCCGYDTTNEKNMPPMDHVQDWDYYVGNDELDVKTIISSTGYNKKTVILGVSCLDIILRNANNKQFKEITLKKLGINNNEKKIIFYAPTFRDFDFDKNIVELPIKKLSQLKDYLILIRLHPLVRDKIDKSLFENDNFVNACEYPDATDLITIADIMITDYSSVFYQFSPLERPIIFYPYDMEEYKKLRGGFYLDYNKDLPGAICYNEDELIDILIKPEELKKYNRKIIDFNKKYNYLADGNASKRLVDLLLKGYFK